MTLGRTAEGKLKIKTDGTAGLRAVECGCCNPIISSCCAFTAYGAANGQYNASDLPQSLKVTWMELFYNYETEQEYFIPCESIHSLNGMRYQQTSISANCWGPMIAEWSLYYPYDTYYDVPKWGMVTGGGVFYTDCLAFGDYSGWDIPGQFEDFFVEPIGGTQGVTPGWPTTVVASGEWNYSGYHNTTCPNEDGSEIPCSIDLWPTRGCGGLSSEPFSVVLTSTDGITWTGSASVRCHGTVTVSVNCSHTLGAEWQASLTTSSGGMGPDPALRFYADATSTGNWPIGPYGQTLCRYLDAAEEEWMCWTLFTIS